MLRIYTDKSTRPHTDAESSDISSICFHFSCTGYQTRTKKLSRVQKDGSATEADIGMRTTSPQGEEDFNQFVLIKPTQNT
jgi:hypothetical protein